MDRKIRDAVIRLLDEIRPKKRIETEEIVARIRLLDLGLLSDFEINERLLIVLKQLAAEGRISLLQRKKDLVTGLPRFVSALRPEEDAAKKREKRHLDQLRHKTAWVPMMAPFAYTLRTKEELIQAQKINKYLSTRKPDEPKLPHRERALRIFGDEKALDGKPIRHGFFNGRMTLDHLDCFYCPEPLPFSSFSLDLRLTEGKPLLVVENANTYWSCCRANETLQHFAAVVYGRGRAIASFEQSCHGLEAVREQVGAEGIVYFGDLDPEGIDIPNQVNHHRHEMKMPLITAAYPLYDKLLRKDLTTHCKPGQSGKHNPEFAIEWLGKSLAGRYLEKAPESGWPQEGIIEIDIKKCYGAI